MLWEVQQKEDEGRNGNGKRGGRDEKVTDKNEELKYKIYLRDNTILQDGKINLEKITLETNFGTLDIPLYEINTIEFHYRDNPSYIKRLEEAVRKLKSNNYYERQEGKRELEKIYYFCYRHLISIKNNCDSPEVVKSIQEVLLSSKLPDIDDVNGKSEYDVVTSQDWKIRGKIKNENITFSNRIFDKLDLHVSFIEKIEVMKGDQYKISVAPQNLKMYKNRVGERFSFNICVPEELATDVNNQNLNVASDDYRVWGTDVYTADSNLYLAAIHAGVVKAGQWKTITVEIVQSPQQFTGTTRNGVTSFSYYCYNPGNNNVNNCGAFVFVTNGK